jgi:hypothetical protein
MRVKSTQALGERSYLWGKKSGGFVALRLLRDELMIDKSHPPDRSYCSPPMSISHRYICASLALDSTAANVIF